MEIIDLSQKGQVRKLYSFEEVRGGIDSDVQLFFIHNVILKFLFVCILLLFPLVTGEGDVTYNPRRSLLGAICVGNKIVYHLFMIDGRFSKVEEAVMLYRKSKWLPQYSSSQGKLTIRLNYYQVVWLFIK